MTSSASELPALPCPECRMRGRNGGARIGNRRNRCTTCNNWAQNVRRLTLKRLIEDDPKRYEEMRLKVEIGLYPQVIEDHMRRYPAPAPEEPTSGPTTTDAGT